MSGEAFQDTAGRDASPSRQARDKPGAALPITIGVLGGIATALGVIGLLAHVGAAVMPELAVLPVSAIEAAMPSLTPGWSKSLAAEAKRCASPLSFLSIATVGAGTAAKIRIRSGSYVSQWFRVTESAQRIALPFPAPYATGHGTLTAEGSGDNLLISIEPGWRIDKLAGAVSRDVTWRPGNAC